MTHKSLLIGALGCLFALTANARDIELDGLYYSTKSDGTATVRAPLSSETKPSGDIVIPATITYGGKDYKVIAIDDDAFAYNYDITDLEIGNGITSIGKNAFFNCTGLTKLSFPASVTEIGDYAFNSCTNVTSITFPTGLKVAGPIFQSCLSLTKVTFSWKCVVTELNRTFQDCRVLPSISIPSSVVKIGESAFEDCKTLAKVSFSGNKLKTIGDWAFRGAKFTNLEIPEGVEEIGDMALGAMNGDWNTNKTMTSVTLPSSLKKISYNTFNNCGALTELTIKPAAEPLRITTYYDSYTDMFLSCPEDLSSTTCPLTKLSLGRQLISDKTGADHTGKIFSVKSALEDLFLCGSVTSTPDLSKAEALKYITVATPVIPTVGGFAEGVKTTALVTVPAAGREAYLAAEGWKDFASLANASGVELSIADLTTDANGVYAIGLKKSYAMTTTINDEDTSAKNLTYTAGVSNVLSYNKNNGKVTSGVKGDAYIYVESSENPVVRGVLVAKVAPIKPVTSITLDGVVDGVLRVTYNTMIAANPVIEPSDADLTDFDIAIEDPTLCTIYAAKAFNPTRNFYELTTFKIGETNVTYTAKDGSGTQLTFKLVVEDRERETPIDYTKGMFWLNEEWFGHCSGSINFVGDDYTFTGKVYERENPFQAFGATSQFATVYADRLVVMSKQARDGGDLRGTEAGGGRVVIADAKTLKKIAAFDEIGGDGRAACGVGPDKFYLTHASGVRVCRAQGDTYVLDAADIAGIGGGSAYANQMGDIVAAGNYAFAVQQGKGLHVIDTTTDTFVKTIEESAAQGVVLAADGNVWMMATKKLYCINPQTAEIIKEVAINQSVACQWGSWRHTNFLAAKKKNVLYWMDGGSWSGSGNIYAWDMTGDVPTEPLFSLGKREGMNGNTQSQYGSIGYDDVNDRLMLATTHGASSNYRYNWYYFVDGTTGEELKNFALTPYYWFPAMPVNPDRAEVATDLQKIDLDNYDDPKTVDLTGRFTDADDVDSEISLSIVPANDTQLEDIADVTLTGKQLTITPKTFGDTALRLRSVSRGHVAYHDIAIKIAKVGVDDVAVDAHDSAVEYYNLQGVRVDADNLTPGIYVRRQGNKAVKVVIK